MLSILLLLAIVIWLTLLGTPIRRQDQRLHLLLNITVIEVEYMAMRLRTTAYEGVQSVFRCWAHFWGTQTLCLLFSPLHRSVKHRKRGKEDQEKSGQFQEDNFSTQQMTHRSSITSSRMRKPAAGRGRLVNRHCFRHGSSSLEKRRAAVSFAVIRAFCRKLRFIETPDGEAEVGRVLYLSVGLLQF